MLTYSGQESMTLLSNPFLQGKTMYLMHKRKPVPIELIALKSLGMTS